jgi:hypothetical protein
MRTSKELPDAHSLRSFVFIPLCWCMRHCDSEPSEHQFCSPEIGPTPEVRSAAPQPQKGNALDRIAEMPIARTPEMPGFRGNIRGLAFVYFANTNITVALAGQTCQASWPHLQ